MLSIQLMLRHSKPVCKGLFSVNRRLFSTSSRLNSISVRMEAARMREHAFDIFNAAYKAVLPQAMIEGVLKLDGNTLKIDNKRYTLDKNVHVVAFGKAVIGMVKTAEDILGEHIVGGIASVPWGIQDTFKFLGKWDQLPAARSKVKIIEGAINNLPDDRAHAAAMEIYRLLLSLTEKDIILALISGGGSSLLPAPIAPITISELVELTKLMSRRGATIQQMNTIRKHIELLKGGGLAKAAYPAQVIGLMMSDVVGNELQFLSSGPTVPDFTTPQQCLDLLDSMGLMDHTPPSIINVLEQKAQLPEFTKDIVGYGENIDLEQVVQKNQPSFHCNNVQNLIIGSNIIALNAGHRFAQNAGYDSYLLPQPIVGDASERGETFALLTNYVCRSVARGRSADPSLVQAELDIVRQGIDRRVVIDLRRLLEASGNTGRPICILAAGETTVRVSGKGRGGRNQQMALSCAIHMDRIMSDLKGEFAVEFLSSGTDGQDGPTDAAGAVVDPDTVKRALRSGMDPHAYLTNNDSYGFFSKLDKGRNQIRTGLTGTNVMDLQVVLISRCVP